MDWIKNFWRDMLNAAHLAWGVLSLEPAHVDGHVENRAARRTTSGYLQQRTGTGGQPQVDRCAASPDKIADLVQRYGSGKTGVLLQPYGIRATTPATKFNSI